MSYAIRTCSTCGAEFNPSSRHSSCPRCRAQSRKTECPLCGALKQPESRVCSKCVDTRGSLNPRWAGGKTRHSSGYVMVSVKGHPRVEGRTNYYVMEHILVMEHFLGRYLYPGENVHHINGVRDDNRIENLELWSKPQPPGCRAEDLLHWAKEVVTRYEPIYGGT